MLKICRKIKVIQRYRPEYHERCIPFAKRQFVRSASTSLAHMVVETIARGTWKSIHHKDYESFEEIPAVLFKVSGSKAR